MRSEAVGQGVAPKEIALDDVTMKEVALKQAARTQENMMTLTKPMLGLAVGGTLGLLDGLSGFLEPSLAPVMSSVITFSLLKGLVSGLAIGYISQRAHSMLVGILAGIGIAAALSFLVILHAGMALFWDIMLPGMLLGVVVGFTTQKFGRQLETTRGLR
jgi:hypothetical protein